jgi:tetratricopeptide (TPR) repeat protein
MALAALWSEPLQAVFGANLLTLWHITNFFLFLASILPGSSEVAGQSHHSDGSQLLNIPQAPVGYMDLYLTSALAMRSASLFNAGDFTRAKAVAERALERAPDSPVARVMIAANASSLGNYLETLNALTPLLSVIDTLDAPTRATIRNDMAFALTMSSATSGWQDDHALQTAERFSSDAFSAYPCILAYRSTRALVLTAVGRPLEALELLQYMHYETASATERGHRECTRAFALHRLGNSIDEKTAARTAIELNPAMSDILSVLLATP